MLKEKFAKLIDLKSIITIALVVATIRFVATGVLEGDIIKTLVLMAVSFYLGAKSKNIPLA